MGAATESIDAIAEMQLLNDERLNRQLVKFNSLECVLRRKSRFSFDLYLGQYLANCWI